MLLSIPNCKQMISSRTLAIRSMKEVALVAAILTFIAPTASRADVDLTSLPDFSLTAIQMIGSHNSYKRAMPANVMTLLKLAEPEVAQGLEYSHISIEEQLALGLNGEEQTELHPHMEARRVLFARRKTVLGTTKDFTGTKMAG